MNIRFWTTGTNGSEQKIYYRTYWSVNTYFFIFFRAIFLLKTKAKWLWSKNYTKESCSYEYDQMMWYSSSWNVFRYIWGGAILFSEWEDWNMLDGSYFCFVSLSTIGFGDIVPGDKIYAAQGLDLSFIFCSMYLMLGECPADLAVLFILTLDSCFQFPTGDHLTSFVYFYF